MKYKVSALGWLCVMKDGNWIPVFKLTDEQLNSVVEVLKQ